MRENNTSKAMISNKSVDLNYWSEISRHWHPRAPCLPPTPEEKDIHYPHGWQFSLRSDSEMSALCWNINLNLHLNSKDIQRRIKRNFILFSSNFSILFMWTTTLCNIVYSTAKAASELSHADGKTLCTIMLEFAFHLEIKVVARHIAQNCFKFYIKL